MALPQLKNGRTSGNQWANLQDSRDIDGPVDSTPKKRGAGSHTSRAEREAVGSSTMLDKLKSIDENIIISTELLSSINEQLTNISKAIFGDRVRSDINKLENDGPNNSLESKEKDGKGSGFGDAFKMIGGWMKAIATLLVPAVIGTGLAIKGYMDKFNPGEFTKILLAGITAFLFRGTIVKGLIALGPSLLSAGNAAAMALTETSLLITASGLALAAGLGLAIGHLINEFVLTDTQKENIGRFVNDTIAFFGDSEAKARQKQEEREERKAKDEAVDVSERKKNADMVKELVSKGAKKQDAIAQAEQAHPIAQLPGTSKDYKDELAKTATGKGTPYTPLSKQAIKTDTKFNWGSLNPLTAILHPERSADDLLNGNFGLTTKTETRVIPKRDPFANFENTRIKPGESLPEYNKRQSAFTAPVRNASSIGAASDIASSKTVMATAANSASGDVSLVNMPSAPLSMTGNHASGGAYDDDEMWTALSGVIAKKESAGGNYNIRAGGKVDPELTSMTLGDVMKDSGAAGKYQIKPDTMRTAMKLTGLSATDVFSPENQELLGRALFDNRIKQAMKGGGSVNDVLQSISQEWAGLPAATISQSGQAAYGQTYYDTTGNNATHGGAEMLTQLRSSVKAAKVPTQTVASVGNSSGSSSSGGNTIVSAPTSISTVSHNSIHSGAMPSTTPPSSLLSAAT